MKTKEIKLHLGCGEKYIPGFIHVDIRKFDHIDYVTSVDNLNMFKNNSVNLIYASHLLEHFKRFETEKVLSEWYRVLKEGGVLRIAVPDFEKIIEVYLKNRNLDELIGLLYGRQDYKYNYHYKVFDFNSLSNMLTKVGFKTVYKYNWRETTHKDYDDYSMAYLPHNDRKGILMSLNIEAIK